MSHNKSFFAPSWDFFSWAEAKSVVSTTLSLAWRTAKELCKSPVLGFMFIVTAIMFDVVGKIGWGIWFKGLMDTGVSVEAKAFLVLLILVIVIFFLYVPHRVFSRILLLMNSIAGSEGRSAESLLVRRKEASASYGLWVISLPFIWIVWDGYGRWMIPFAIVYFAQIFLLFMDAQSKEKSSWYSIKRYFWVGWRLLPSVLVLAPIGLAIFLPIITLVGVLSYVLTMGVIKLWLVAMGAFPEYLPGVAVFAFSSLLMVPVSLLLTLAHTHTLYTRIMSRHRDLFFEETHEDLNEQN